MKGERRLEADALRGFALLGIGVVNLPIMAGVDALQSEPDWLARAANFVVAFFFQGKSFVLFSFLFGWGFAQQMASAERRGIRFGGEFARRLLGLLAIGVAHAVLVFPGDVLVLYALLGALLFAMRRVPTAGLLLVAAAMVPLASVALGLLGLVVSDASIADGQAGVAGATWLELVRGNWATWPAGFGFTLLYNGPLALACFLAGLAAARARLLEAGSAAWEGLRRKVPALLVAGAVVNLFYALGSLGYLGDGPLALVAFMSLAIGGPLLGAVYLWAVVELWRRSWVPHLVASVGRMSLTAYIGQGVLAGLLLYGYGWGRYGLWDGAICLLAAYLIYEVCVAFAGLWLRWRDRGPMEVVLRWMTRGTAAV